jgi:hypothetical protein
MRRVLLALVAVLLLGVAGGTAPAVATTGTPPCDVTGFWNGFANGQNPVDQANVTLHIFNQRAVRDDDRGSRPPTSVFQWETTAVTNGASARGFGALFPNNRFIILGRGNHPVAGNFSIQAQGAIVCVGGQGTATNNSTFRIRFDSGLSDSGSVQLVRGLPDGGGT